MKSKDGKHLDAIIDPRLVENAHLQNPDEWSLIEKPISSWKELCD